MLLADAPYIPLSARCVHDDESIDHSVCLTCYRHWSDIGVTSDFFQRLLAVVTNLLGPTQMAPELRQS
jgi:hypothetical protein